MFDLISNPTHTNNYSHHFCHHARRTGGIPAEITTLPLLERLHLHNNAALGGPIPEDVGDLTALRELFLYSSGLTGEIPQSLGDLAALVTLALNNNALVGDVPDSFDGLAQLQVLDLARNQLEKLTKNIGKLPVLEELYLNSNRFEGDLPKEIGGLTNLKRLYAENNLFSGDAPDFSRMLELEELGLAYNKVAGDDKFPGFEGDLPNLGGLRKLTVLRLHESEYNIYLSINSLLLNDISSKCIIFMRVVYLLISLSYSFILNASFPNRFLRGRAGSQLWLSHLPHRDSSGK